MPQPRFTELLEEFEIPVEQLLLDPNNPRLQTTDFEEVSESRIGKPGVQRRLLRELTEGPHDLDSLRASIRTSGLLPIDRIVVRPLAGQTDDEGQPLYVLVEGNRRIAAVKTLLRQDEEGEIELSDDIRESLLEPTVLVLQESEAEQARLDQWVIQGIRHITGIRPWGGYQAARTIETMIRDLDYDERDVAAALSLSITRIRRALRVLSALDQMQEDDEYADYAEPDLYAYFDEVIRRRKVRDWLGWDVEEWKFDDEERLQMLYSWIVPDDELNGNRRIASSDLIRQIDPVLDSEAGLAVLNTPGNTIHDALAVTRPITEPEWREPIKRAISALKAIPTNVLEDLEPDDRELIAEIRDLANHRLELADRLQNG